MKRLPPKPDWIREVKASRSDAHIYDRHEVQRSVKVTSMGNQAVVVITHEADGAEYSSTKVEMNLSDREVGIIFTVEDDMQLRALQHALEVYFGGNVA